MVSFYFVADHNFIHFFLRTQEKLAIYLLIVNRAISFNKKMEKETCGKYIPAK